MCAKSSLSLPVLATLLVISGCALFRSDGDPDGMDITWPELRKNAGPQHADTEQSASRVLKAAIVEANIVRQPVSDPRIRTLVWEGLDESGLMSPEDRQRLNRGGFRVGVAGGSMPWALQSLARDATQVATSGSAETDIAALDHNFQLPVGPTFSVFERGVTRLEVQPALDPAVIPVDSIAELQGLQDLRNLRCAVEVTVTELNSDWALLTAVPQIYAGTATTRLTIQGNNSQLPVRQNTIPLYQHQFRVKLHRGEVAVIGRHGDDEWNAGRLFFQPDSGSAASECLLLIRLADVSEIRGRSDTSVAIGKKYVW